MSGVFSWPLQQALHDRLIGDTDLLDALGGPHIHDAPPHASAADPPLRLLFGAETIEPWNTMTEHGAIHDLTFEIWSRSRGFGAAKRALSALCTVLDAAPPALSSGRIIRLDFVEAVLARDETPGYRRIDCVYRVVIEA